MKVPVARWSGLTSISTLWQAPRLLRCLVNCSTRWRNAIWYHLKVLKTTFCLFTFPFRSS
ncbi:hypothetical protein DKG79_03810 [Escherichia fergusonii]|uniref:Uncharacterized protein n=1 Tax=Escherichia coli TaxID=562 RepID=A0A2K3TZR0_ECOLX|nr:hypothetical protein DKG79_03810 [Escherichia fergusonii]PNY69808.1 hypothetical protein C2M16_01790 [Escherichia coli]